MLIAGSVYKVFFKLRAEKNLFQHMNEFALSENDLFKYINRLTEMGAALKHKKSLEVDIYSDFIESQEYRIVYDKLNVLINKLERSHRVEIFEGLNQNSAKGKISYVNKLLEKAASRFSSRHVDVISF